MASNIQDDCVELFNDATHGWDITPAKPTITTAEDVISVEFVITRYKRVVIILPASDLDQEKVNDYFENVMYTLPVVLSSNTTDDLEDMFMELKRCCDSFKQLRGVGWTTHNTLTYAKVISAIDNSKKFMGSGKIYRMDCKVQMGNFLQDIVVARDT